MRDKLAVRGGVIIKFGAMRLTLIEHPAMELVDTVGCNKPNNLRGRTSPATRRLVPTRNARPHTNMVTYSFLNQSVINACK